MLEVLRSNMYDPHNIMFKFLTGFIVFLLGIITIPKLSTNVHICQQLFLTAHNCPQQSITFHSTSIKSALVQDIPNSPKVVKSKPE
jgi:hypothetical protein